MLNDARVKEVSLRRKRLKYRMPLKFGGQRVSGAVYCTCTVLLEDGRGRTAEGRGGLLLGTEWAWPATRVALEARERLWQLGRSGGYFCNPDQGLPWPPEHLEVARQAVAEFGRYPLSPPEESGEPF